jgi:NADP-dependent 3-hydroxy acid dehydrogenase YdfG
MRFCHKQAGIELFERSYELAPVTGAVATTEPLLHNKPVNGYHFSVASSTSGKIAVITGGASGIGAALAAKLVDSGAEVWIGDRQVELAEELAHRLSSGDPKAHATELDVRSYPSFERTINEVVQQSGRIDYLFNNAGIGLAGEADSLTLDDWNEVFNVNLRGIVHGIQAVYPIMIRQHSGHIVNTASIAGLVTTPGAANYSATKHAVVAISKTLRVEAKRHGVQVSVLCPGAIRTPILTGGTYGRIATGVSNEEILKFWDAFRPMTPERFATRALHAVQRGDAIIVVPAWWKALWYLERLSPMLSMRLAEGIALKRMRALQSNVS